MATTLKDPATRRTVIKTFKFILPAGGARPGPPISPAFGPLKLDAMGFCKGFNAQTQKYAVETPIPVRVTVYEDKTLEFVTKLPPVSWYLKKAAAVESGSSRPGHSTVSSVTLKHVYEIAKVKQADPGCQHLSLEAICKSILGTAKSIGIEVVREL